jgi:arylsulfatase A-like enzyme
MIQPRAVILITVDCLRADHVGFMGYGRPVTPFLDSLAAGSLVLTNAVAAGVPTYHSAPAIMASRYPLAMGRDVVGVAAEEPTLASSLSQMGFATAAFVAANPYLSARFGYAAAFDVFQDFLGSTAGPSPGSSADRSRFASRLNRWLKQASQKLGPFRFIYDELYFQYGQRMAERSPAPLDQLRCFPAADVLVDRAAEWLQGQQERPLFLWLHLMDPHGPYYPKQAALDLMGNTTSAAQARSLNSCWMRANIAESRLEKRCEQVMALYDAGIRWVDEQVSSLVKTLRSLGLWEDCVFALTADHGEEFLEHGGVCHAPPKLTEELIHVPLLLRVPRAKPGRNSSPFSLLDLAPTLLDAMGFASPAEFRGESRWPQLQSGESWSEAVVAESLRGCSNPFRASDRRGPRILAVRETRYKLLMDFSGNSEQLYDLESDPAEKEPLALDSAKPVRRRLLERARRHIAESLQSRDMELRVRLWLRNLALDSGEEHLPVL